MKIYWLILLVFVSVSLRAQHAKHVVYLIPGQGADQRLYKNIRLDSVYEVRNIEYFTPEKGWDMTDFALQLAQQIDTTQAFSIIGVSLGGMLATEMNDFLHPENVIVISSAKSRKELPFRYRFQKTIPIYKLFPPFLVKAGARVMQPIVEPDRMKDPKTFNAMLKAKDPLFLKRTIKMILEWEREDYAANIIHIHGGMDKTIPARNVAFDYLIEEGSHMMILTQGELVGEILNNILDETVL